jgi:hypothetical protein
VTPATGWPFLVARGRETGYQLLLAPDFVLAGRDAGLLLTEVTGEVPAQGPSQVSMLNGPSGPLAVVQRTVRATRGDVGETERPEAPLLDRAGRPILLGYGFVARGVQVLAPDETDLWHAQEAALTTYRRFHAAEYDFEPEPSAAYPLRSTVGPAVPVAVAAPVPAAPPTPGWSQDALPPRKPEPGPRSTGLVLAGIGLVLAALVLVGVFALRGNQTVVGSVAVPDVVGMNQAAALQKLEAAKLTPVVTMVAIDPAPAGTVISTDPAAEQKVPVGTTVHVTVSSGLAKLGKTSGSR